MLSPFSSPASTTERSPSPATIAAMAELASAEYDAAPAAATTSTTTADQAARAPQALAAAAAVADKDIRNIYQYGQLGTALTDALDDLVMDERLPAQLAPRVVGAFNRAMNESFPRRLPRMRRGKKAATLKMRAELDFYRCCDDVWTFALKNVRLEPAEGPPLTAPRLRLQCQKHRDAKEKGRKAA
ncbi:hypothetical protein VTK26DRAFT_7624 [Humicola hyalothermophila]